MKELKYKENKLLILNVPPPYGGGEIRAKITFESFQNKINWIPIAFSSNNKNKSNQGSLTFRTILDVFYYIWKYTNAIVLYKPIIVFVSIPKSFLPLLKIVPLIILKSIFKFNVVGELAGSSFYFLNLKNRKKKFGLYILNQFTSIRVLGQATKKYLESYGVNNSFVMDNGVNINSDLAFIEKEISSNKKIELLFVGALHKAKGIFILAEIAKILNEINLDFTFNILGEWANESDKIQFTNFITKNKIEKKFSFQGVIKNDKKWKFYSDADLLIFPSYNEGQPLTILEALSFGIPIISSNVGLIEETITNENGFILKENKPEFFVESILGLLNNPSLYNTISRNNIKLYNARYTEEIYINNFENWIQNNSKNN